MKNLLLLGVHPIHFIVQFCIIRYHVHAYACTSILSQFVYCGKQNNFKFTSKYLNTYK